MDDQIKTSLCVRVRYCFTDYATETGKETLKNRFLSFPTSKCALSEHSLTISNLVSYLNVRISHQLGSKLSQEETMAYLFASPEQGTVSIQSVMVDDGWIKPHIGYLGYLDHHSGK